MTLAYVLVATLLPVCAVLVVACVRLRAKLGKAEATCEELMAEAAQQQKQLHDQRHQESVQNEFISTVSHELRTPLTSIRGALGLLSSGMLGQVDATAHNLLRIASTNTDRLVRLINDILDLERMDSERGELQLHRCSLPELIVQAVETMATMANDAGVNLQVTPGAAESGVIFQGDPDRILQLLCNLLSNAIKFSPRGGVIRIHTDITPSDFLLRVEDEGRGIPAEKLESIFDRFQQVEASDSKQKGGSGLGLAICRSIAKQHGGSIWAERNDDTAPGKPGSTFVLQMPRMEEMQWKRPAIPAGTLLVCDDDAGVRHILAEQLRQHGYTVLEAEGGEQALQLAAHQQIQAILLDLYMPGMSGWDVLERLKANAATASIPVIVLSVLSPAARTSHGASLIAAAQGWVQKPFTEKLLMDELGRVLRSNGEHGHVLLVEDDRDLATVVLSGFAAKAEHGVHVEHVRTMQEAKDSCMASVPQILILDVGLPDGTGFALVDWLRQQPALSRLPLIVYSGRHLSEQERTQLRLGPTQFLAKGLARPKDLEELVLTMVQHLRVPAEDRVTLGTFGQAV